MLGTVVGVEPRLNNPFDLAFSPASSLAFSDTFNHCTDGSMRER